MTDKIDTSADLVARLRDHGQHEREEMNHTWRRFRVERLEAADAIDALRAEVERLREALEFYASPQTYVAPNLKRNEEFTCAPLLTDRGVKAKTALKGGYA